MPRKARRRLVSIALVICCALLIAEVTHFALRDRASENARAESRWIPAVRSDRWTCIVIHHSASEAGGAEQFDQWHRDKGWDGLGYHFVIGNGTATAKGQVEVGSRWIAQKHGAHTRTGDEHYNQHGIGVCLVGNFDLNPPDELQLQSLRRLVTFLCREFRIPPDHVYTHGGITEKTNCPGKHFDLESLRRDIVAIR